MTNEFERATGVLPDDPSEHLDEAKARRKIVSALQGANPSLLKALIDTVRSHALA
jgi:hypothetical protein